MRQEKRVWWSFSAWEADLFEQYLEDQALQGWFPEKIGNFGIKFSYGKPEKRRYATVLVPGSSTLTGVDSWAEKKFQERCEDSGWKFQCRGINWQVFYTTDENVKRTEEMSEARQFEIQKSLVWGWLVDANSVSHFDCFELLDFVSEFTKSGSCACRSLEFPLCDCDDDDHGFLGHALSKSQSTTPDQLDQTWVNA